MAEPRVLRRKSIVLEEDVLAIDTTEGVQCEVKLPAGAEIYLEISRFEWSGREGLYSEISVNGRPGRRYRVRQPRLGQACQWPKASSS